MTREKSRIHRRTLLLGGAALTLGGCDRIASDVRSKQVLASAETLTSRVQRLLSPAGALAREFAEADLSPAFKANGTTDPDDDDYQAMAGKDFAEWTLDVDGLVERPAKFSLAELRALPSRTQITRHDCVEGWSAIAKWRGARLGPLLDRAGVKPAAKYVALFCADTLELTLDGSGDYYETINLVDARHPQTLLAYEMNDAPLPVAHGAPIRLRLERQLGYKMAKYVMRIELVDSFAGLGLGKGGYWEDRGYQWYAGI